MKKLIFLHIPKTAGQSLHQFLVDSFEPERICPARVNRQLVEYTSNQLNSYQVFSGHFDWNTLEKLNGEKIIFTVLRNPLERILSFYHYLHSKSLLMSSADLAKPENKGLKIIQESTPNEYFCSGTSEIRTFVDDHFDNFYMYYLASKQFEQHRIIRSSLPLGSIFRRALVNLCSLHAIFTIHNWNRLSELIELHFPNISLSNKKYVLNKGDCCTTEERLSNLSKIGPAEKAVERIKKMYEYDQHIYGLAKHLSTYRVQQ